MNDRVLTPASSLGRGALVLQGVHLLIAAGEVASIICLWAWLWQVAVTVPSMQPWWCSRQRVPGSSQVMGAVPKCRGRSVLHWTVTVHDVTWPHRSRSVRHLLATTVDWSAPPTGVRRPGCRDERTWVGPRPPRRDAVCLLYTSDAADEEDSVGL